MLPDDGFSIEYHWTVSWFISFFCLQIYVLEEQKATAIFVMLLSKQLTLVLLVYRKYIWSCLWVIAMLLKVAQIYLMMAQFHFSKGPAAAVQMLLENDIFQIIGPFSF